jgi:diguanylate cyclase (GGDEF)-like protein/PAS domain S-box-containing protein
LGDLVIDVRASIGLACRAPTDVRVDLVERAFLACRRAKASAPGTIVGYEGALGIEADRRQRVQDGLRRAVADQEFRLFVQPKIDLNDGAVVGVEALIRWQHPDDGLLAPGAFLPDAEAAGMMVTIGDWVLEAAFELADHWRTRRRGTPMRVWVNLAAQQLAAGDHLRRQVAAAFDAGRIDARSIGFEVTESSLLEDLPGAVGVLSSLRELGVDLALDDFGTGYSSLSYLRQLPVTDVKIDQRFVAGIGGSLADEVIVEAVIDLAHALGLRVVAEGVEHVGQADALVRMGADRAQGYHFARPMPPDDLELVMDLPWCGAVAPESRDVSFDRRADDLPGFGSPRARLLLAAFDNAHDSVVITTAIADGKRPPIVYVNEAFRVETGHELAEVIGRSVEVLLPHPPDPGDLEWIDQLPVSAAAGAASRELPGRRADGTTYLCEVTVSPILDERGTRTHWLHVRRDLTQRRDAEGARARFQGLIEQTASLVLLAETGGQCVYANAAQRRAIGLSPDAPVEGVNVFDVLAGQIGLLRNEVIPSLQTTGIWSGEAEFVDSATGVRTEVYADVQVMDDPLRPGMRFFAAVSRDVTEVNALARTERRRRELGSFAAEVAHGAMHLGRDEFLHDLDQVLARFGLLIGADRVYVDSIDLEAGRLRPIGGWSSDRYPTPSAVSFDLPLDQLSKWVERLHRGGVLTSAEGAPASEWAAQLSSAFGAQTPAIQLYAPLRVGGELLGVLGLSCIDMDHRFSQVEIETVQQVADTLANLFGRQRAANALAASERRQSAMLTNIGDVLLVIDQDGWIKFVNDRIESALGHHPVDVINGHFLTLVHPEDRDVAVERFAQTVSGEQPPVTEVRVMHADGSSVWFDVDTAGTFDELLGGYVVSLRNMSAQRASMEDADRRAELESVVLELSKWALEVEPDGIIAGLNVHLEQLGRAMGADIAFAALLDGDSVRNVAGWAADGAPHGYVMPVGLPVPAIVARYRTLEPLVVSDIDEHDEPWADEWRSFPVPDRAGLNMPLVSDGRCLGNVGVAMSHLVREWTPAEISVVRRASETVSAVLVRQRVEASLRASEQRLSALLDVAQTALDLDADDFFAHLPTVCRQVAAILDVDFVYVDRLDEGRRTLVNLGGWVGSAATPVLVPGQVVSFDHVANWVERLRQPEQIVVEDASTCGAAWAVDKRRSMGAEGGMMAVAMATAGELFGVVGVSMATARRVWTDDEVTFLRIVAETISHVLERSRLDAALRSSEARFRLLSDTAADVVILVDGGGLITYVSPSSMALVGRTPDELVGLAWRSIVHTDDRSAVASSAEDLLESGSFSSEMRLQRADGSWVWVVSSTSSVFDTQTGAPVEYRTSVRDITDRKRLEAELERQALHDPLTGLGNRILLQSRLEVATARRGPGNDVAVLLVDLDSFKEINDTWGHAVGDDVLRIVATRLRALARPSDTVARTGGDEFVLLCPETDRAAAIAIGHRIVTGLGAPLSSGSITVRLGASVGVAHHRGGAADPDAMLIAADHAMYAAKRNGRGGVDVAPEVGPAMLASTVLR